MPGTPVRSQIPGYPHKIESVSRLTSGRYQITTNQGSWEFLPSEVVVFPRRPDGAVADWRRASEKPRITDLAVGDYLEEPVPEDQRLPDRRLDAAKWDRAPEIMREQFDAEWLQHGQRVVAITRAPNDPDSLALTTKSPVHGTRRWVIGKSETISFPRQKSDESEPKSSEIRRLRGYGPYRQPDGFHAFVIDHPNGRGRWPKWISHPIQIARDVLICKPPGKGEAWPQFLGYEITFEHEGETRRGIAHGTRYDRHPQDPRWGQLDAELLVKEREVRESQLIFESYRERFEG